MAFATTFEQEFTIGNLRLVSGTYTSDGGSTGGNIQFDNTETVFHLHLQPKGSAVVSDQPAVNETLPLAASDDAEGDTVTKRTEVTIVTKANEVGTFFAIVQ